MLKDRQSGQVFLVALLVMVVAFTVGLSVASKTIVSLRTSREETSSKKALAAAEAGIEQVLKLPTPIPIGTSFSGEPNTTYGATVGEVLGDKVLVNGGNVISKDDGADIWLVDHNSDGTPNFTTPWSGKLTIYWGDTSGACTNAAIEIAVISGPVASPVLKRYAYDPCTSRENNFSSVLGGGNVSGKAFSYSASAISVSSGFLARVVPLYASSSIGVVGEDSFGRPLALPSQGTVINATGESSGTKRNLSVFKGYPQLPVQYLYGLFSP
jgi:hypothetical protein